MKRFIIVVCLASAIPGWAGSFPWWFHTRPKPVIMDDQPPTPAMFARNRAPNPGTAVQPVSRRSDIFDNRRERQAKPSNSWLTEFLTRGWRGGAQRSK
jgi:hypothetical protein